MEEVLVFALTRYACSLRGWDIVSRNEIIDKRILKREEATRGQQATTGCDLL